MRKIVSSYGARIVAVCSILLTSLASLAQEKVEIDTGEAVSWFERNWMWVAGAIVLIVLIAALSRNRNTTTIRGGKRRTTTVVEDAAGNTKSVTTTEENI